MPGNIIAPKVASYEKNYISYDAYRINKGNFYFVFDFSPKIYDICLQAESKIYTNYHDSLTLFRTAIEYIGIEMEVMRRIHRYGENRSTVENKLQNEIRSKGNKTSKKGLFLWRLARLNRDMEEEVHNIYAMSLEFFGELPESKKILTNSQDKDDAYIVGMLMYSVCSESSHNPGGDMKNALNIARILYQILQLLINGRKYNGSQFDESSIPIDDYFPVPMELYSNFGIANLDINLYVKESSRGINFYIINHLGNYFQNGHVGDRRNAEIIYSLWNDSWQDPNGVIHRHEEIGGSNSRMEVMAIPSCPKSIDSVIEGMSIGDKWSLVLKIADSIRAMHSMIPIVTHRCLNPDCYLVCDVNGNYRAFLYRFDTAKKMKGDSDYTVSSIVDDKKRDFRKIKYLAPEVIKNDINTTYADRADIYSFAKIMEYMLTKEEIMMISPLIASMCDNDYKMRPGIEEVIYQLKEAKGVGFEYVVGSQKSPKHRQQDAFYVCGCDSVSSDDCVIVGKSSGRLIGGVFDGLGGGYSGEEASRLIAHQFGKESSVFPRSNHDTFWRNMVAKLQYELTEYMNNEGIDYSGTTIVAVNVDKDKINVMNIGDSRAYLINSQGVTLLTKDHRYSMSVAKRKELYQYIGMDEDDVCISPYVSTYEYGENDYILLCTDGLSDYVDINDIKRVAVSENDNASKVKELLESARVNGSDDDLTVILIKVER